MSDLSFPSLLCSLGTVLYTVDREIKTNERKGNGNDPEPRLRNMEREEGRHIQHENILSLFCSKD